MRNSLASQYGRLTASVAPATTISMPLVHRAACLQWRGSQPIFSSHRAAAGSYHHVLSCRGLRRVCRAPTRVVAGKLCVKAYLGDEAPQQRPTAAPSSFLASPGSRPPRTAWYVGAAAVVGAMVLLRPQPSPMPATTPMTTTMDSSSKASRRQAKKQAAAAAAAAAAAQAMADPQPAHFSVRTGMALPVVELAEVQLLDAPFKLPTPGMLMASLADLLQLVTAPLLAALAAAHRALSAAPGSLPLAAAAAAAAGGVAAVVLVAAQGRLQQRQGFAAAIAAALQQLAARLGRLTGLARAAVVPAPDAWIRHVSNVWSAAQQGQALGGAGAAADQQTQQAAAAAAAVKQGRVWGLARPPSEAALRATRLLQELFELPDGCSGEEVVRLVKGLTSFDLEVDDKGHQLASVLHPDKMMRLLQALAWRMDNGQFLSVAQQLLSSYPAPHLLLATMQLQGASGNGSAAALSTHLLSDIAAVCPGPCCPLPIPPSAAPGDKSVPARRPQPFDNTGSAAAALRTATHPFTQYLAQAVAAALADTGFPRVEHTRVVDGPTRLPPGSWMVRAQAVEALRWLCDACPAEQLLPLLAQLPAKEVRRLMPVIEEYDQAAWEGAPAELSRQQQLVCLGSIYRQHLLVQQSRETGPAMQAVAAPAAQAAVLRALCIDYWQQTLVVIDKNLPGEEEGFSSAAAAAAKKVPGALAEKLPADSSTSLLNSALAYVSDVDLADCTYMDGRVSPSHDTVSGQHLLLQDVVDAVRAELQVFDHAAYLGVETSATFSQEYWPLLRVLLEQLALHWQLPRADRMRMVLRELLPRPALTAWAVSQGGSMNLQAPSALAWDAELAGVAGYPQQQKLLQGNAATYLAAVSGRAMSGGNPLLGSRAAWEDGVHLAQTMLLLREYAGEEQQGLGAALVANAHPQHLLVAAAALPVAAVGSSSAGRGFQADLQDGAGQPPMADWRGVLQEFVDGAALINRSRSAAARNAEERSKAGGAEARIASWAWTASLIKQLVQFAATAAGDMILAPDQKKQRGSSTSSSPAGGSPAPGTAAAEAGAAGAEDDSRSSSPSSKGSLTWSEHRLAKQARELYAQSCLLVASELLALVVDRTAALHLPGWLQQVASVAQLWQKTAESVLNKAVPPLLKWGPGTEVTVNGISSKQLLEPLKDMLATAGKLSQQLLPQSAFGQADEAAAAAATQEALANGSGRQKVSAAAARAAAAAATAAAAAATPFGGGGPAFAVPTPPAPRSPPPPPPPPGRPPPPSAAVAAATVAATAAGQAMAFRPPPPPPPPGSPQPVAASSFTRVTAASSTEEDEGDYLSSSAAAYLTGDVTSSDDEEALEASLDDADGVMPMVVVPDKVLGPGEEDEPDLGNPEELLEYLPRMRVEAVVAALTDMAGRVGAGLVVPGRYQQCVSAAASQLTHTQVDFLVGVLADKLSVEDFLLCSRPLMPRGADIPMLLQQLVWRWETEAGLLGPEASTTSDSLERRRHYLQMYVEVYYGRSLKL